MDPQSRLTKKKIDESLHDVPASDLKAEKSQWDDFIPKDHPHDKRLAQYVESGKVDRYGFVHLEGRDKFPKPRQKERIAVQEIIEKPRKWKAGSYRWIDFFRFLRHQQTEDRYGSVIFGDKVALCPEYPDAKVPPIKKIIFIGSKFRETIDKSGYLHLFHQKLSTSQLSVTRRRYVCHDYDVRVIFDSSSKEAMRTIIEAARRFFTERLGEDCLTGKIGGWRSDDIHYAVISIQEKDDLPTEWLLIQKLSLDHLCTEDRLQGELANLNQPQLKLFCSGEKSDIFQGALDTDCGFLRFSDVEKADYAAWCKLIVGRSFGKLLAPPEGGEDGVETKLLETALASHRLPQKIRKSLKGSADHQLAIFLNAACSLMKEGIGDAYLYMQLMSDCLYTVKKDDIQTPALALVFSWLNEESFTFTELLPALQALAFFSRCPVRKEMNRPVLFWEFDNGATLVLPMLTDDALRECDRLVKQKNKSLFASIEAFDVDPFYVTFADRLPLSRDVLISVAASWLEVGASPCAALALLMTGKAIDPSQTLGPILSLPSLLDQAEPKQREKVWKMVHSLHLEEVNYHPKQGAKEQFLFPRLISRHPSLKAWAYQTWAEMSNEEKTELLPKLVPKLLKEKKKEIALSLMRQTAQSMDPKTMVMLLCTLSSRFKVMEWEALELALTISARQKIALPKRDLIRLLKQGKKIFQLRGDILDTFIREGWKVDPSATYDLIQLIRKDEALFRKFASYFLTEHLDKESDAKWLPLAAEGLQWLEYPCKKQCKSYCSRSFTKAPKKWVDRLKTVKQSDFLRWTFEELKGNDSFYDKKYKAVLEHVFILFDDHLTPQNIMILADRLLKVPTLLPLYIKLVVKMLRIVNKEENIEYEALVWAAENALIVCEKKGKGTLADAWMAVFPLFVRSLHDHDPAAMLSYWERTLHYVTPNAEAAPLIADVYEKTMNEPTETYLLGALKSLSVSQQSKVVTLSLKKRISEGNRSQALRICKIGKEVLGDLAALYSTFLQFEGLAELKQLLNGSDSETMKKQLFNRLIEEEKFLPAIAMVASGFFEGARKEEIAHLVLTSLNAESVAQSSTALLDLIRLCDEASLFEDVVIQWLSMSIGKQPVSGKSQEKLHGAFLKFCLKGHFVAKTAKDYLGLCAAFYRVVKVDPMLVTAPLKDTNVLIEMAKRKFLSVYWGILVDALPFLGSSQQLECLLKMRDVVRGLFFDLALIKTVDVVKIALKYPESENFAYELMNIRLHASFMPKEELIAVVTLFLDLKKMDFERVKLLMQCCACLVRMNEIDRLPTADIFKDVTLMLAEVPDKQWEALDKEFRSMVWDWLHLMMLHALKRSHEFDKKWIALATYCLVHSFQYNPLFIDHFIETMILVEPFYPAAWNLLIGFFREFPHANSGDRKLLDLFDRIAPAYAKISGQLDDSIRVNFFRSLFLAVCSCADAEKNADDFSFRLERILPDFSKERKLTLYIKAIESLQEVRKCYWISLSGAEIENLPVRESFVRILDHHLQLLTQSCLSVAEAELDRIKDPALFWRLFTRAIYLTLEIDPTFGQHLIKRYPKFSNRFDQDKRTINFFSSTYFLEALFKSFSENVSFDEEPEFCMHFIDLARCDFCDEDNPDSFDFFAYKMMELFLRFKKLNRLKKTSSRDYFTGLLKIHANSMIKRRQLSGTIPSSHGLLFLINFLSEEGTETFDLKTLPGAKFPHDMSIMNLFIPRTISYLSADVARIVKKIPSKWIAAAAKLIDCESHLVPYDDRLSLLRHFSSQPEYIQLFNRFLLWVTPNVAALCGDDAPHFFKTLQKAALDGLRIFNVYSLHHSLEMRQQYLTNTLTVFYLCHSLSVKMAAAVEEMSRDIMERADEFEGEESLYLSWVTDQEKKHHDCLESCASETCHLLKQAIPFVEHIEDDSEPCRLLHEQIQKLLTSFYRDVNVDFMINSSFLSVIINLSATHTDQKVIKGYAEILTLHLQLAKEHDKRQGDPNLTEFMKSIDCCLEFENCLVIMEKNIYERAQTFLREHFFNLFTTLFPELRDALIEKVNAL